MSHDLVTLCQDDETQAAVYGQLQALMAYRTPEEASVLEFLVRVPVWFLEQQWAWMVKARVWRAEIAWAVTLDTSLRPITSGIHERTVIAPKQLVWEAIQLHRRCWAIAHRTVKTLPNGGGGDEEDEVRELVAARVESGSGYFPGDEMSQ